jgi:ribosomal protein S3
MKEEAAVRRRHKNCDRRAWNSIRVTIFTARPASGAKARRSEDDRRDLKNGARQANQIDIQEIKSRSSMLNWSRNVALQGERRIAYRRAMKRPCRRQWLARKEFVCVVPGVSMARRSRSEWYREENPSAYAADGDRPGSANEHGAADRVKCWL